MKTKKPKQQKNSVPADRHLDIPSEANRDKHINFTALEQDEIDPSDQPASGKLGKANVDKKRPPGK